MSVLLFGVASEGLTTHWDGSAVPQGVLLRWLLGEKVPPPPHGFVVSTAVPETVVVDDFAGAKGETAFTIGDVTVASVDAMTVSGPTLNVGIDEPVVITLARPATAVRVTAGGHPQWDLRAAVSHSGSHPEQRAVSPGESQTFHGRAINTILLTGPGAVASVEIWPVDPSLQWSKIAQLCLPVAHPNHPARRAGSFDADADLAKSRLPLGVWESAPLGFDPTTAGPDDPTTYERELFAQLHPELHALFEPSPPAFLPDDVEPSLELGRWEAIQLAAFDPHVARMLGLAFDHVTGYGILGSNQMRAYKVTGGWQRGQVGPGAEREAVIAALPMRDPGPPAAPSTFEARITQPSLRPRVGLRWDTETPRSQLHAPLLRWQPFGRQLNDTGAVTAVPDMPGDGDRLVADPLLIPSHVLEDPLPRDFTRQRGVAAGRWAWWVRGIDVLGRAGAHIHIDDVVVDRAAPPPPALVNAFWIQSDLPGRTPALPVASRWRAAHPNEDGVAVRWAWTPELHDRAPDVDAFAVVVRRPTLATATGVDWTGADWEPHIHEIGPAGTTEEVQLGVVLPSVPVTVTRVGGHQNGIATLETNLSLEDGVDRLIGTTLSTGGTDHAVVSATLGPAVVLRVQATAAPSDGPATLSGGAIVHTTMTSPQPSADPDPRTAGLLVTSHGARIARIGTTADADGIVAVVLEGTPTEGPATWFPAWEVVVRDDGWGPRPSATLPVAPLQVGVVALRPDDLEGNPRVSVPAGPGLAQAVDTTPPPQPRTDAIPGGKYCAEAATAADVHGTSYMRLSWQTDPNSRYRVHRALWAAVVRTDRAAAAAGSRGSIDDDALPVDATLRAAARDGLDALDQALGSGDDEQIAGAYDALPLHARAALASQPWVRGAYTAVTAEPIAPDAVPFEDAINGRTRAHWVWRIEPISAAGVPGEWSAATPPICAPDVVAPPAPQVQQLLAEDGGVRLRWLQSTAADLDHWLVLHAPDMRTTDVRDMDVVAELTADPMVPATATRVAPLVNPDNNRWLEYVVDAPARDPQTYRIVAVDTTGNQSPPSAALRGAALAAQPEPPVWADPSRTPNGEVALSWSADDDRLVCMIERRPADGGRWKSLAGWLPRGRYDAVDRPPNPSAGWEYRLRVVNADGLPAAERLVATLDAEV